MYKLCCNAALPNTCKGATAWDTLNFCPTMTKLWHSAAVDEASHMFDAHAPLTCRFALPALRPATHCWRMPVSWAPLKPSTHLVEKHYLSQKRHASHKINTSRDLAAAFQEWAANWEQAVHEALQQAHEQDPVANPVRGLGRQHRGRCKPRTKKFSSVPALSKKGRCGDFDPPCDPVSVRARQKTRQVRRIESFLRNQKVHLLRGSPPAGQLELTRQWAAICRAGGYPPSFPIWILKVAHFIEFHVEWVSELLQYARFDCEAEVRTQAKRRVQSFKQRIIQDEVGGSPMGFRQLRRPMHPPVSALPVVERQPLSLAFKVSPGVAAFHCSCPQAFHCAEASLCDGRVAKVLGILPDPDCDGTSLLQLQLEGEPPVAATLQQRTAATTPELLCRQFTDLVPGLE